MEEYLLKKYSETWSMLSSERPDETCVYPERLRCSAET